MPEFPKLQELTVCGHANSNLIHQLVQYAPALKSLELAKFVDNYEPCFIDIHSPSLVHLRIAAQDAQFVYVLKTTLHTSPTYKGLTTPHTTPHHITPHHITLVSPLHMLYTCTIEDEE